MGTVIYHNFRPQNDDFVPEYKIPAFLRQDTPATPSNTPPNAGGEVSKESSLAHFLEGVALIGLALVCLLIYVGL